VRVAAALALALAGCGALNGADYEGEPLYVVRGELESLDPPMDETRPRPTFVTAWWVQYGYKGTTSWTPGSTQAEFPARFVLPIYSDPPIDVMTNLEDVAGVRGVLGEGQVLVYEDVNGNGSFEPYDDLGDPLDFIRGAAQQYRVLFATDLSPEGVEALRQMQLIKNPEALQPGYNLGHWVCEYPLDAAPFVWWEVIDPIKVVVLPYTAPEEPCPALP